MISVRKGKPVLSGTTPTTVSPPTKLIHGMISDGLVVSQYCDGLRGAMVIYDPNDPHRHLYDVDDGEYQIMHLPHLATDKYTSFREHSPHCRGLVPWTCAFPLRRPHT